MPLSLQTIGQHRTAFGPEFHFGRPDRGQITPTPPSQQLDLSRTFFQLPIPVAQPAFELEPKIPGGIFPTDLRPFRRSVASDRSAGGDTAQQGHGRNEPQWLRKRQLSRSLASLTVGVSDRRGQNEGARTEHEKMNQWLAEPPSRSAHRQFPGVYQMGDV